MQAGGAYIPQPGFVPGAAAPMPPMPAAPTTPAAAPTATEPEAVPGLRWTFSTYPNTGRPKNHEQSQWGPPTPEMVIPLAAMYTPLYDPQVADPAAAPVPIVHVDNSQQLAQCRQCHSHFGRCARVDFEGQYWMCPGCLGRNPLPLGLAPGHPALTAPTVEYIIDGESQSALAPIYIFVVDVCLPAQELEPLKASLIRSLEWLPENALVGIVSFGHSVTLWEPGFGDLNKCYAFRGNRSYARNEVLTILGVPTVTQQQQQQQSQTTDATQHSFGTGPIAGRFLVPLSDAEFVLTSVLEELQVDPFPAKPRQRPLRATGAALELAVTIAELVGGAWRGGKVMLFTGGPCTRGPGAIVTTDKAELIRSYRDLLDGNAPLFQPACDFYSALEARLSECRIALDAMVMSLDQVGALEMRPCIDATGGNLIAGDSFTTPMYTESFKRLLLRSKLRTSDTTNDGSVAVGSGFGALVRVFTSTDTRVSGALGPCRGRFGANAGSVAQAQGDAKYLSPIKLGVSDTTQWVMSSIDTTLTLTVVFDTEQEAAPLGSVIEPSAYARRFVQFVTAYTTPTGEKRVRVTSVAMPIARTAEPSLAVHQNAFDQHCAAVVLSRIAIDVMERHDNRPLDLTRRWIDRVLVRFVKKYGTYRIGDPESLRLAPCFSLFPVFLFNLRRSEYFMLLNISPDETTMRRHYLRRETCENCLLMIQPIVDSYDAVEMDPKPVPLDSSSLKRENILLMDAYFQVAVLRGATVEEWRKAGYHLQPEYANFKQLLERPERDAEAILATRLPYPRYTNCDQYDSQARHVLTKLNPSVNHTMGVADSRSFGAGHRGQVQEVIYTDDANIARFMQTLKAAAVKPDE